MKVRIGVIAPVLLFRQSFIRNAPRGNIMSERRILNSWKEIASYLGRGVRTVQRWEAQLGLPVHRPAGKDHSAVVAFSSELDQWLDSRPVRQIAGMQLLTSS